MVANKDFHEFFLMKSIVIRTSDTTPVKKTGKFLVSNRLNHFNDLLGAPALLIAVRISVYYFYFFKGACFLADKGAKLLRFS